MKITKIEVQKKNKNRANLYIDDIINCGLSLDTILKNHLKVGQEISSAELDFLKTQSEDIVALNKAVNYLSKTQKTQKEMQNYLIKKGFEEETATKTIKKLEEYHFVDDEDYSKNYIKFKNKNNGSRKIEFELKLKGVDEEISKKAIEEFANDREAVVNVLEKYLKNKEKDAKTKQKAYRYLMSKGFMSEDINFALNKFFSGEEDYESWNWHNRNWKMLKIYGRQ